MPNKIKRAIYVSMTEKILENLLLYRKYVILNTECVSVVMLDPLIMTKIEFFRATSKNRVIDDKEGAISITKSNLE